MNTPDPTGADSFTRRLWQRLETIHAVTYFADESRAAAADAGLKGFWMGYFGFRAAPLGKVTAPVVEATFANFAPGMVRRAIPDAWSFADPDRLIAARRSSAAAALRRLSSGISAIAVVVQSPLERVVAAADPTGRPLFAANASLPAPDDPVEELWQLTTCLREHRGETHIQLLAVEGIDGIESHLLHAAQHRTPAPVLRANRGWSEQEWSAAHDRLVARGLLGPDGALSATGVDLRHRIETDTDRLAQAAYDAALSPADQHELLGQLTGPAGAITESGVIPYPNPIGLQPVESTRN